LFEKCAKVGNNSSYTLSQTFPLQQVAYTIDEICAMKKTVQVILSKSWQKTLTSLTKSTLNQSLISQASNIL